jgi:hypothetical protein
LQFRKLALDETKPKLEEGDTAAWRLWPVPVTLQKKILLKNLNFYTILRYNFFFMLSVHAMYEMKAQWRSVCLSDCPSAHFVSKTAERIWVKFGMRRGTNTKCCRAGEFNFGLHKGLISPIRALSILK